MQNKIHFSTFRPINLFITFGVVSVVYYFADLNRHISSFHDEAFWLFISAIVLITAAGYWINDYLDQKADAENKPNKNKMIGLSRRTTWGIYLLLNGLAIAISFWLNTLVASFLWFTIALLFCYSFDLKNRFFWGNLVVAGIAGLLPLLILFQFKTQNAYVVTIFFKFFIHDYSNKRVGKRHRG